MTRRLTFPFALFVVSAAALFQAGCGSGNSSVTPTSPTAAGGGSGASVVITITGMNGSNSFSPNPASVPSGQTVAWKNADSTTHQIVQDSGAFDTGALAPGATSRAITVGSGALPYHCTIHPSMVGTINGTTGANPGTPY